MKKMILALGLSFILTPAHKTFAQAFYRNSSVNAAEVQPQIVNMFPNPSVNNATVVLNYIPEHRVMIDIVDFNGQVRRSFVFAPGGNQFSFDTAFLESGYYMVRVRQDGGLIDMAKLLKS